MLFLTLALGLSGCLSEKTTPPGDCDVIVSYSLDIKPIINSSCMTNLGSGTGCHDDWITDYSQLAAKVVNGTLEYQVFTAGLMPQQPNDFGIDTLTSDEKKAIKCWIEQGHPEN